MKRTSSMVASVLSLASLIAWTGCSGDTTVEVEEASGEAERTGDVA